MFVDFDKIFSKTPQTELKIPKALAEQLSSKLPNGLKYVVDDKTNNLIISYDESNEMSITIKGMSLNPTNEQLEILGEDYHFDDLIKLSYNSQKPIPVKYVNDRCLNINGKEIPIDHLAFNPFKPYEIKVDSTYMYPSPFPPAFSLSIGCEKAIFELTINRVANNSVDIMAFESQNDHCLSVKYYFNPKTNSFSITINIMPKYAVTVKEIIDSIEIYNAFIDGKGIIAGTVIETKLETSEASRYDSEALEFWTKVYELENKLRVTFAPPFVDIDFEDVCNIEEIYQNIINKLPIRKNIIINSITSEWAFSKDDTANETLGKPIYFEFEGTSSFEVSGQKIELPCIVGIFNAVLSKYEKNEDKCTLFLESESDEKQMYTSTLCFLTKQELIEYKQKTKNRITLFRDAKKRNEYLIK